MDNVLYMYDVNIDMLLKQPDPTQVYFPHCFAIMHRQKEHACLAY